MIDARNKTGCKLVYIIEGNDYLTTTPKIPKTRIPFKNLRSHLDHIALRDDVIIIRSRDYTDTANRIIDFAENFCTLHKDLNKFYEAPSYSGGNDCDIKSEIKDKKDNENISENTNEKEDDKKEDNQLVDNQPVDDKKEDEIDEEIVVRTHITKNDNLINLAIWKSISGVTEVTYSILSTKYIVHEFILGNVTVESICLLKYPSGRILGESKCNKIIKSASSKKIWIKMLSKIQGITKETATHILEVHKMRDIVNGKIDAKYIANIKKSKRRLGNVVAERIIRLLQHPDIKNKINNCYLKRPIRSENLIYRHDSERFNQI